MTTKEGVYQECLEAINQRLLICEKNLAMLQESLTSETKSSAGDKHETGRAMIQLEREQLGQQLAKIEREQALLTKINPKLNSETVCLGSLVITSEHSYFIAIGLGKMIWNGQEFYAISLDSPIGQLLVGKRLGEQLSFAGKTFEIQAIM
ncbi:MAG TPA: hypothetical protein VL022_03350 [Moheibacter sp.]|nr:hypothetical protein [Moheibacter sp.]